MVLDLVNGEGSEKRYAPPPSIKFEDLKILGYTLKKKLLKQNEGTIDLQDFVERCVELENRSRNEIPEFYTPSKGISYLPDPRCKAIYVVPSDLFTAKQLKPIKGGAYVFGESYPYYEGVRPVEIRMKNVSGAASISFGEGGTFRPLKDGVYNFNVFSIPDGQLAPFPIDEVPKFKEYNNVSLKATALNRPASPLLKKNVSREIGRLSEIQLKGLDSGLQSFWHLSLPFEKEYTTWKSVKYLEETTSFRLPEPNGNFDAKELRGKYSENYALLEDELPYEAFLYKEGDIRKSILEQSGLIADTWPEKINIKFALSEAAKKQLIGTSEVLLFSFRLNDTTEVKGYLNPNTEVRGPYSLYIGETKVWDDSTSFELYFNRTTASFAVVYGPETVPLKKIPFANLTISDMVMPEAVLNLIQHDPSSDFDFIRSATYILFNDLKTKFYKEKKLKFFASSIFQSYYPKEKTEFRIGSFATKEIDVKIPNNVKPVQPVIDLKLLLKREQQQLWDVTGSKAESVEQMAQILLEEDFCKEGPNKLGIVLNKLVKNKVTNKYELVNNADDICEVGEDITKLVKKTNWTGRTMQQLIKRDHTAKVIQKYYPDTSLKHYKIAEAIYEVLEATPFFNVMLRRWQVLVPLANFESSETMYLKFVVIKIAPGQVMQTFIADPAIGIEAPYMEDASQTCISDFSKPEHLPLYNRKSFRITRKGDQFIIAENSTSDYENKVFFVMLVKKAHSGDITSIHGDYHSKLVQFSKGGKSVGDRLMFDGKSEIQISRENCDAILIQEFEIHSNVWIKSLFPLADNNNDEQSCIQKSLSYLKVAPKFVTFNPLFDVEGIRLVNSIQIKI